MTGNETYLDIVWQQFKKNRPACWALWMMVPLFLLAIFAPAIASNQPFVFRDGTARIYPWFSALFNAPEIADYIFNMALVGFFPWLVLCVATEMWGRMRGLSGRQRMALMIGEFILLLALLCAAICNSPTAPRQRALRAELQPTGIPVSRELPRPLPPDSLRVDGNRPRCGLRAAAVSQTHRAAGPKPTTASSTCLALIIPDATC